MNQNPSFKTINLSLTNSGSAIVVTFSLQCACGTLFNIRDKHNYCFNCGRKLPKFDPNRIIDNKVCLSTLIDLKGQLKDYLDDWLEETMITEKKDDPKY